MITPCDRSSHDHACQMTQIMCVHSFHGTRTRQILALCSQLSLGPLKLLCDCLTKRTLLGRQHRLASAKHLRSGLPLHDSIAQWQIMWSASVTVATCMSVEKSAEKRNIDRASRGIYLAICIEMYTSHEVRRGICWHQSHSTLKLELCFMRPTDSIVPDRQVGT